MPKQFGHQRIAPQIGDVGELARVAQQSVHEGQRLFERQQVLLDVRQGMRQRVGQSLHPVRAAATSPRTWRCPRAGESRWSVNSMAIDLPLLLNSNFPATVW